MKLQRFIVMSLLLLAGAVSHAAPAKAIALPSSPPAAVAIKPQEITVEDFGMVRLFKPAGAITSVAILASGDGRWDDPLMQRLAQPLLATGAAVVGIDTVAYLKAHDDNGNQCLYMGGDFEDLAHAAEKYFGLQRYLPPMLVGYSSGASLVYSVLAQAPRGMFQGGISLSFCAEFNLQSSLCSARGVLNKPIQSKDGPASLLLPVHQLSADWVVMQGAQDQFCTLQAAREFSAQVSNAQLHNIPKADHFFVHSADWLSDYTDIYRKAQIVQTKLLPPAVSDLPVTEVPSTHPGDELAILLTGDGGWAELDQELARDLNNASISVVALSSLQYFWKERTPKEAAAVLSRLMDHYAQTWQRPRIRLFGYSFGADVLPAIVNALSPTDRARIDSIGLLALLPRTSFEIHVAGWFGKVVGESAVRPELDKILAEHIPVTCVYGTDAPDSLCRELPPHQVRVVPLPGGHNCNDDHAAIVSAWLRDRSTLKLTQSIHL